MRGTESYLHKYAKQTLASWLRNGIRIGAKFEGLKPVMPVYEENVTNKTQPMFGIYEEYPIAYSRSLKRLIGNKGEVNEVNESETDWHNYFDLALPATTTTKPAHKHGIPTMKELKKNGDLSCNFIFDVAMLDASGKIVRVFEICHTNPIESNKIKWLDENAVIWYELSAEWIMKQCKSPYTLEDGILRFSNNSILNHSHQ